MTKLTTDSTPHLAMVGKSKTPKSLAGRMPTADVAAKVGVQKAMTPLSLAARMPSAEIVAKVGVTKVKTPGTLAARMPSPEVAAKVGVIGTMAAKTHRVVRRNAHA